MPPPVHIVMYGRDDPAPAVRALLSPEEADAMLTAMNPPLAAALALSRVVHRAVPLPDGVGVRRCGSFPGCQIPMIEGF